MSRRPDFGRLGREHLLPAAAALSIVTAILVVIVSSGSIPAVTSSGKRVEIPTHAVTTPAAVASGSRSGASGPASSGSGQKHASHQATSRPSGLPLARALGQLIIARFHGVAPTSSILSAIRAGQVGGIILFSDNTAGGISSTRALVGELQSAARAGGNPRLLIMTDQEGGLVKRLPGPPNYAADEMGNPSLAAAQGAMTAQLLRAAGVNVDLAPVADVPRVNGFMYRDHRTFGGDPTVVASAACAFARALSDGGVAYTLKHFPGLGDTVASTDNGPVTVQEDLGLLRADAAAYQLCGAGSRALVMVSSAAYAQLTGSTPAVLSSTIYTSEMAREGINAVTISDDFEAPAMTAQPSPARRAIAAGLNLVLYAQTETASAIAYQRLLQETQQGLLRPAQVEAAASRVLALKRSLHLT